MRLIFLGPPGAGKGTIAQRITEELRVVQISTGDLLRAAVKAGSPLGIKAKGYMDAGELVPDTLVINMLKERIGQPDCANGFILDGFPRTIPQADALEQARVVIDKVINFVIPDALVIRRLSGRRIHTITGKIYNVNPGGVPQPPVGMSPDELLQRDDDKAEAIANRLVVYREQTEPLIAYYQSRGILADIAASQDLPAIVAEVKAAIRM
jgi:adenylate kinase